MRGEGREGPEMCIRDRNVGYGKHARLKKPRKVGIVQAGAQAGFFVGRQEAGVGTARYLARAARALLRKKRHYVNIRGQKVPVLGMVGLNHLAIDLSETSCRAGATEYNLLELKDYRNLPNRKGYRKFYLNLAKMIYLIKYKIDQGQAPYFTVTVDQLAKEFDVTVKDNHDRKKKVTCGEHGGEPSSVKFCHRVGLNYVSCSPFRVPIARLAAAQAAIEG